MSDMPLHVLKYLMNNSLKTFKEISAIRLGVRAIRAHKIQSILSSKIAHLDKKRQMYLMEIFEGKHGSSPTIIASQLRVGSWPEING